MEPNTLLLGDCVTYMKRMWSESVDMILTDPPYNIAQKDQKIVTEINPYLKKETMKHLNFGKWDEFESIVDFDNFCAHWLVEAKRVLKPGGSFIAFSGRQFLGIAHKNFKEIKNDFWIRDVMVWHKTNPRPNMYSQNKFVSSTEFIVWAVKGGKTPKYFNPKYKQHHNFFETQIDKTRKTNHPCEKPISILNIMLDIFSEQGDIILDPFSGSGAVSEACKLSGRKYISMEKDEEWFMESKKRLQQGTIYDLFNNECKGLPFGE